MALPEYDAKAGPEGAWTILGAIVGIVIGGLLVRTGLLDADTSAMIPVVFGALAPGLFRWIVGKFVLPSPQ